MNVYLSSVSVEDDGVQFVVQFVRGLIFSISLVIRSVSIGELNEDVLLLFDLL